jgi:hypothetical protein
MNGPDILRDRLEQLAAEVAPVDLSARVRASSRRLGRQRATAGVAGVLVVAAVGLVVAVHPTGRTRPAPAVTPAPEVTAPAPTALPTISYDQTPPALGPLANVTMTIPTWGSADDRCATGRLKITDGQYFAGVDAQSIDVIAAVASDVDLDGTVDYVADLRCGADDVQAEQVVAFRRSGVEMMPIGRVVGSQDGPPALFDVQARAGGQVAVRVGAGHGDIRHVATQWRVYALHNGLFSQVAGPTAFPGHPPAADLRIAPATLVLRPASGGGYAGELAVTVSNAGDLDVPHADVRLSVPVDVRPAGGGWSGCAESLGPSTFDLVCPVDDLAAGSSRTLRFSLVAPEAPTRTENCAVMVNQLAPYVLETEADFVSIRADLTVITR